jgi:hypothetical protein
MTFLLLIKNHSRQCPKDRCTGSTRNLQTRQEGSEFRRLLDTAGQLACMNVGRILLPELW